MRRDTIYAPRFASRGNAGFRRWPVFMSSNAGAQAADTELEAPHARFHRRNWAISPNQARKAAPSGATTRSEARKRVDGVAHFAQGCAQVVDGVRIDCFLFFPQGKTRGLAPAADYFQIVHLGRGA